MGEAAAAMSQVLLRGARARPRGPAAAARKGPRKAAARRDWDSTVHDLTVHRATPEDILRRHEIHKSKNKALVHLELQEKALKRKCKKQKQLDPDSLEKRKLALMREILSDQYHLQDVLERSDEVMAVAKHLFGDAPRTRTDEDNHVAGKREPWLVNPPYQSVVEFLVTSSEASDADHFCSKVTKIHRVPVCAPRVVRILVATWIACLFLDIAGVVSASCECCFSISYPGL